jgi:hypothetical protein
MPPVAGRDEYGVDVVAGEQFAEVSIERAVAGAILLIHHLLAGVAAGGLHVGDGDALHVGQGQHRAEDVAAAVANADDAKRDAFTGSGCAGLEPESPGRDDRGQSGGPEGERLAQKRPPRRRRRDATIVIRLHHCVPFVHDHRRGRMSPVATAYRADFVHAT